MAQIHPFRGLRYPSGTDYAQVITPPYDIIDAAAQIAYHQRHPENVIRLELGYQYPEDTSGNNRYTRAATTFAAWQESGVLQPESAPSLYLLEEAFTLAGAAYVRTSFFAAVQVTDYGPGRIMPHEHTLAKPVSDRLDLLRACRSNFSPIFGLYPDDRGAVVAALRAGTAGRPPDVACRDEAGNRQRLWVVSDSQALAEAQALLARESIYIADGHHRYETARRFHRENPDVLGSGRVLMVLAALNDPGLVVLPTHRIVDGVPGFDVRTLLANLTGDFTVATRIGTGAAAIDPALAAVAAASARGPSFGIYTPAGTAILTLANAAAMAAAAADHSAAWQQLDVAILHTLVLDRQLGIGAEQARDQKNLAYTRDARAAAAQVDAGQAQMAIFMNPLPVNAVTAVADARDNMPQKSTYFYPKYVTGLVMHQLSL